MWNSPTQKRMSSIPGLYKTENTPLKDKLIYLHFFISRCDWYVAEYDNYDTCWGFVILNNDYINCEWGYFSLSELQQINIHGVQVDCELEEFWEVKPALQIKKIAKAQGWQTTARRIQQTGCLHV